MATVDGFKLGDTMSCAHDEKLNILYNPIWPHCFGVDLQVEDKACPMKLSTTITMDHIIIPCGTICQYALHGSQI